MPRRSNSTETKNPQSSKTCSEDNHEGSGPSTKNVASTSTQGLTGKATPKSSKKQPPTTRNPSQNTRSCSQDKNEGCAPSTKNVGSTNTEGLTPKPTPKSLKKQAPTPRNQSKNTRSGSQDKEEGCAPSTKNGASSKTEGHKAPGGKSTSRSTKTVPSTKTKGLSAKPTPKGTKSSRKTRQTISEDSSQSDTDYANLPFKTNPLQIPPDHSPIEVLEEWVERRAPFLHRMSKGDAKIYQKVRHNKNARRCAEKRMKTTKGREQIKAVASKTRPRVGSDRYEKARGVKFLARVRRSEARRNAEAAAGHPPRRSRRRTGKPTNCDSTDDADDADDDDDDDADDSSHRKTRSDGRPKNRHVRLDDLPDRKRRGKSVRKNKVAQSDTDDDDASYVPEIFIPPVDPRSPHYRPKNQAATQTTTSSRQSQPRKTKVKSVSQNVDSECEYRVVHNPRRATRPVHLRYQRSPKPSTSDAYPRKRTSQVLDFEDSEDSEQGETDSEHHPSSPGMADATKKRKRAAQDEVTSPDGKKSTRANPILILPVGMDRLPSPPPDKEELVEEDFQELDAMSDASSPSESDMISDADSVSSRNLYEVASRTRSNDHMKKYRHDPFEVIALWRLDTLC